MRIPPFPKATLSTLARTHDPTLENYVMLLGQCAAERSLEETRRVHRQMMASGFPHLSLGNKLVDAYLKCGAIDDACHVLDAMPKPHIVSWNAMISSCVRCWRSREAIALYKRMLSAGVAAGEFTFSAVLRAFSSLSLSAQGAARSARAPALVDA